MIFKNLDGKLSADYMPAQDDVDLLTDLADMATVRLPHEFEQLAFSVGIEDWIRAVIACHQYVDTQAPWALRNTDPARLRPVVLPLFRALPTFASTPRPLDPART